MSITTNHMLLNNWNKLHSEFFSLLIKEFHSHLIRYFILRNFEKLPEQNIGKDVDIVVEPQKYGSISTIITNVMQAFDIHYYTINHFDRLHCWYIMDLKQNFSIHIDIIENEVYKGFEFFDFNYLYSNCIKYKDFMVLEPAMDCAMLLIQNIVAYKSLKPKYRSKLAEQYNENKQRIDSIISDFWGEDIGGELSILLSQRDFDTIVERAFSYERRAVKRIFSKRPFYTTKNVVRFLLTKIHSILLCPKRYWHFIAVEAPDGAGKTTFINGLVDGLQFFYNCSSSERFNVHHFRPSFLPNLGAVGEKAKVMKQDTDFTKPHRAKPAGFVGSILRMVYYWCDYAAGVPIVLRREAPVGVYTIFDRYIYDFLIDPKRSKINLPRWVRLAFVKMTIQPQVVFILNADADIIYQRKQELEVSEIRRQLCELDKLAKSNDRFVTLNANEVPQEVVNEALQVVFDKFFTKI